MKRITTILDVFFTLVVFGIIMFVYFNGTITLSEALLAIIMFLAIGILDVVEDIKKMLDKKH